jgi:hypothetical protein
MRMELEYARKELETSFQSRVQAQADRESELLRVSADKERRVQQMEFEARQHMQRELDELRCREEGSRRKAELETQATRMLETRLKEMQVRRKLSMYATDGLVVIVGVVLARRWCWSLGSESWGGGRRSWRWCGATSRRQPEKKLGPVWSTRSRVCCEREPR